MATPDDRPADACLRTGREVRLPAAQPTYDGMDGLKEPRTVTGAVHVPYTVERDEDGFWCAHAQLRPGVGANGEGDSREAAVADLREALDGLIAEFGSPQEFTRLQSTWSDATSPVPTWRAPSPEASCFGRLPCQSDDSAISVAVYAGRNRAAALPRVPPSPGVALAGVAALLRTEDRQARSANLA